jgi:hypothetical protein
MPAVIAMASAPQKVTRTIGVRIAAPPVLVPRKPGRLGRATPLLQKQGKHDGNRDQIEGDFVNFDEGRTEAAHGLLRRLVHQRSGTRLNTGWIDAGSGNLACKQTTERRPEQIGTREHETRDDLHQQEQKQQGDAYAPRWVMTDILLRLAGEECRRRPRRSAKADSPPQHSRRRHESASRKPCRHWKDQAHRRSE